MQGRDLTPSLREDGHPDPAGAQSLVLPPSVEVPIGDKAVGELRRGWGRENRGLEGEKGSKLGRGREGVGEEQRREEGERTSCQGDPFLSSAFPHSSSQTSLR